MCNGISHPAGREVKMIEGLHRKGKRRRFGFEILEQEGRKI